MSVRKVYIAGSSKEGFDLSTQTGSDALEPVGSVHFGDDKGQAVDIQAIPEGMAQAIRVASLCNVATIQKNDEGKWVSTGDPTEVALQVFATKLGMGRTSLTPDEDEATTIIDDSVSDRKTAGSTLGDDKDDAFRFHIQHEFPFSSETKKMSTIYYDRETPGQSVCLTKGAVSIYKWHRVLVY